MRNKRENSHLWQDYIESYIRGKFRSEPIKEHIYHYTNIEGLYGILSANCLWASNINYINDSTEYRYGIGLLNDVLDSIIDKLQDDTLKKYLRNIEGVMDCKRQKTYCISFCEYKDSLSQWRGYTGGTNGVSIGFSNQEFAVRHNEGTIYYVEPLKVIYGKPKGRAVLKELIMKMDEFLISEHFYITETQDEKARAVKDLFGVLCGYLALLKDWGFREEKEWRIAITEEGDFSGEVDFRLRGNILLPYICLNALNNKNINNDGMLPVSEIVVSPSGQEDLMKSSIEFFLKQKQIHTIAVNKSRIPFRG